MRCVPPDVRSSENIVVRTFPPLARLSCGLRGCLLWLRRGCGFPLLAVLPGGLAVELLLNGSQFLPEGFHLLSQSLRSTKQGVGCISGCYGRRRMLQHLIIDGEKSIGERSFFRPMNVIGP